MERPNPASFFQDVKRYMPPEFALCSLHSLGFFGTHNNTTSTVMVGTALLQTRLASSTYLERRRWPFPVFVPRHKGRLCPTEGMSLYWPGCEAGCSSLSNRGYHCRGQKSILWSHFRGKISSSQDCLPQRCSSPL